MQNPGFAVADKGHFSAVVVDFFYSHNAFHTLWIRIRSNKQLNYNYNNKSNF